MKKLALMLLVAVGQHAAAAAPLTQESARYEAQKIVAAIEGQAQTSAFMDVVLQDEVKYQRIFVTGLKPAIAAAPVGDPAFERYRSCADAGAALLKFAELRKLAGRQNAESDKYRTPYWESLATCKKAVK